MSGQAALGQAVYVDEEGESGKQVLSLPYGYYNETFGFAAAYIHGVVGYPQPQSSMLATAMVGSKGSAMVALIAQDIQVPRTERLFVDPIVQVGFFGDADAYVDGNPKFPTERAGSNSSDEDNFVNGDGWDNFARIKFKYLLPIGHGKDEIISTYVVDRGMLASPATGAESWNPLDSGKSYLELRPFYRWQQIDGDDVDDDFKTNGADLGLYWDNRDFDPNPSRGESL